MPVRRVLAGAIFSGALVGCAASTPPASTPAPTVTALRTASPAASPAATRASPTVVPVPSGARRSEVILRWAAGVNIADIDDVSEIIIQLKNFPGIFGGFGDETQITVVYDAQLTTPDVIRRHLADMGYPTRP
jgi:hypothetical protein